MKDKDTLIEQSYTLIELYVTLLLSLPGDFKEDLHCVHSFLLCACVNNSY